MGPRARAQGGANLHELKARLDLLNQYVGLHGAGRQCEMVLEGGEDVAPQRGFFSGLDLRQIQHDRGARLAQPLVVVDDVEHGIDDGG